MSPFKTCRACHEKDLTVRWYVDSSALLCVPCHIDGAKATKVRRADPSRDEHPHGLVTFSPAALAAMGS